jgi:hypothetical protein
VAAAVVALPVTDTRGDQPTEVAGGVLAALFGAGVVTLTSTRDFQGGGARGLRTGARAWRMA